MPRKKGINAKPVIPYDVVEEWIDMHVEDESDFILNGVTYIWKALKAAYPIYSRKSIVNAVHEYYRNHNLDTRLCNVLTIVNESEHAIDCYLKKYGHTFKKKVYKRSEEERKRISENSPRYWKGKKMSEEQKEKIRESLKKVWEKRRAMLVENKYPKENNNDLRNLP